MLSMQGPAKSDRVAHDNKDIALGRKDYDGPK